MKPATRARLLGAAEPGSGTVMATKPLGVLVRLRPDDPRQQPDRHDPRASAANLKAVKRHAVRLAADAREGRTP
jgi:hypothetical protein